MAKMCRRLSAVERVRIELGRKDSWGVRELGRGRARTAATPPGQHRRRQRGGGRRAKLAPDSPRFAEVAKRLRLQGAPAEKAGRRKRLEDGTEVSSGLRVRRSTRRSTPCRAVSCSPACVRA